MTEVYDGTQDIESTVVRFTADWCMPCKQYAPLFERAAEAQGETWLIIDVDEHPDVARNYGVMSIPTVLKGGQRVDNHLKWTRELM